MKDGLIEKIKSQGYWRINFQPLSFRKNLKSLADCKNAIEKVSFDLRGWDYPYFPRQNNENEGLEPCGEYYQGWIDWGVHKEFWRIYKSEQFLQYLAFREDWYQEDEWFKERANLVKPGTALGVNGSLFLATEVFEFVSRLIRNGLYKEGVNLSLTLHNIKDRELWIEDPGKMPLRYARRTGAEEIKIERKFSVEEILTHSRKEAINVTLEIFDNFDWGNPSRENLEKDQDRLLSGHL